MRASRRGAVLVALVAGVARGGAAQQALPLKRTFVGPLPSACASKRAAAPATAAAPAKVEEARRLFTLGQEASVVGDHRAARDLFLQAGQLNGADERVPYYLGRSLEELQQPREAAAQYCRYLTLAPTGFDADDVRARLDRLGGSSGGAVTPAAARTATGKRSAAATRFRAAVDMADRGKLGEAERAFDDVVESVPNAPEAFYDRGVLRATRRDFGGAADDFERYLALRPDADDGPAVRERLSLLRRASTSPSAALWGGILPGFGQFYTGRPVLGLVVAGGAAAGTLYALQKSDETRTTTYEAPFGGTYDVTDTVRVRKHVAVGFAVAGASALIGAVEGYAFAQRRRAEASRFASGSVAAGNSPIDRVVALRVVPVMARAAAGGPSELALAVTGRVLF